MEQWNSGAMERWARRMNGGTVWPLALALRGSWHPHFRHKPARKEQTMFLPQAIQSLLQDRARPSPLERRVRAFRTGGLLGVACLRAQVVPGQDGASPLPCVSSSPLTGQMILQCVQKERSKTCPDRPETGHKIALQQSLEEALRQV